MNLLIIICSERGIHYGVQARRRRKHSAERWRHRRVDGQALPGRDAVPAEE